MIRTPCGKTFKTPRALGCHTRVCKDCDGEVSFWLKVDKGPHPKGCWLWKACHYNCGYGSVDYAINGQRKKMVAAHRVAYFLAKGPFDNSLDVCHSCDVRNCVNPAHLWLGTARDNMQDCLSKGRSWRQRERGKFIGKQQFRERGSK
jgi:hypothetical protein